MLARKGNPLILLLEGQQIGAVTVETVWMSLRKLKIELSYDPIIPLLGIYLKETKTLHWKDSCTPMFVMNGWRRCHTHTHTHTHTLEYYTAIRKNEILPSATTWMDLEGIMLSEISQTEKDKYLI